MRKSSAALALAIAAFCLFYVAMDLNRFFALRYGLDLGTFSQTLMNVAHGSSWNWGEWRPHFLVHDSWLLAVLAVPMMVFPYAQTLLVAQVFGAALAAIPLASFARAAGASAANASAVAICYLLSPTTQGLAYDNFSENDFVPLLAFFGAWAARVRSFPLTLLAAQALMGLKEDEILFVGWFGLACALFWDRRIGIAVVALAAINGAAFLIVEHAFAAAPNIPAYGFHVTDIAGKIALLAISLGTFAFFPLRLRWTVLLAAPIYAEIVFAQPWNYELSRVGSHYAAPLVALCAIAAAVAIVRIPNRRSVLIACALVAGILLSDSITRPGRYPYVVDWKAYDAAVALIGNEHPPMQTRDTEGVWAVAAVNPNLRIALDPHVDHPCPAYNRSARAFFASIGIGTMPATKFCGGVPIE